MFIENIVICLTDIDKRRYKGHLDSLHIDIEINIDIAFLILILILVLIRMSPKILILILTRFFDIGQLWERLFPLDFILS